MSYIWTWWTKRPSYFECDLCYIAAYCEMLKNYQSYTENFQTQTFWYECGINEIACCQKFSFFLMQFVRYGILMIIAGISVDLYGNDTNNESDYNIKNYEYFSILFLLIGKIVLQIGYFSAPKYDEYKHSIYIMESTFGSNVAWIIISYLGYQKDGIIISHLEYQKGGMWTSVVDNDGEYGDADIVELQPLTTT